MHDLLCPSLPCSGVEGVAPVTPTNANTPGATLNDKLTYLQNNPSSQYTEVGPFSGVAGIFLQMTREAGLNYDVSIVAVSAATLTGYANNTGAEANDLSLIDNAKFGKVVLQDQSFQPLPATVTVNGQSVPTRGKPASFQSGVSSLVNGIDSADAAAGKANAAVYLAQTPPLAAYGYTSTNPNAPIFGSSTVASQNGNKAYAPYVGAANPIAQMASDLHNAYVGEAAAFNLANPTKSHLTAALDGDAWVSAINLGLAEQNPYLAAEPSGQIDLWDSDPLLACCTVPIGYHPSAYGDYLNAATLFATVTGIDPRSIDPEFNSANPAFSSSAANALGISAPIAYALASAAEATVLAGNPVPEPSTLAVLALPLAAARLFRRRR